MTLKPSEKRLLIFFAVAAFLAANIAAWTILQQKSIGLKVARTKFNADYSHLKALQTQAKDAAFYQETLGKYLAAYASLDDRDTYLGNFIQSAVNTLSLKISKNAPLALEMPDLEKGSDFIKSGYQAEVSGEWKRVLEFIHRLQSPTDFRYVKSLSLATRKTEAQDGESELVCNFVLQKWWHPESQNLLDKQTAERELAASVPPSSSISHAAAPSVPIAPAPTEPTPEPEPAPAPDSTPAVAPASPAAVQ